MNRLEKKNVRLNMIRILDTRCRGCEMRSDYDAHRFCIENCDVSLELQHLSSTLLKQEPENHSVDHQEKNEVKSGRWTSDEEFYLLNHMSRYSVDHLAERLNRSPQSIYSKIYQFRVKKIIKT